MARYIDADKTLEFIKETNANYHWLLSQYSASWIYDFIESRPAADVVPKSEVEKLENEVERLTNILNSYALQYGTVIDKHIVIERARDEVAREIFEEIEKLTFSFGYGVRNDHTVAHTRTVDDDLLAKLKKKYTGVTDE